MIKKLIYILILIILNANIGFAKTQTAQLEYSALYFEQNPNVAKRHLKAGENNFAIFLKTKDNDEKIFNLRQAMRNYYLAGKFDSSLIDAEIGLGRVYDAMKLDRYAKEHFSNAINISPYNPRVNYYFGDFYFKRNDFLNALFYYKISYEHGFSKNFELNLKLAIIYEKIADLDKSKNFYTKAFQLKPNFENLREKIRLLDELNYEDSQYYLFIK